MTESKGMKNIFYANENQKIAGVSHTYIRQIYIKAKTVVKDKKEHYIIKHNEKEDMKCDAITFVNMYA